MTMQLLNYNLGIFWAITLLQAEQVVQVRPGSYV